MYLKNCGSSLAGGGGSGLTINGLPSGTAAVSVFSSGTDLSTREAYTSAMSSGNRQATGSITSGNNCTLYRLSGTDNVWTETGAFTVSLQTTNGATVNRYYADITFANGAATVDFSGFTAEAQLFTSILAFKTWLDSQPDNTAATAYRVVLNISDLGGSYSTNGSLGAALYANYKYVNLDLTGSTFTSIPDYAFIGYLTGITIPSSVTSIGYDAFSYYLATINVTASNNVYSSQDGVLYNKAKTTLIQYPEGKAGSSFTIPDSVTRIWDSAFNRCESLTGITIPNSVTSIGGGAFSGCTRLAGVTIPNSVTSIGDVAFAACYSLASINIPNGVTSIGERAFYYCTSLASITIPAGVTSIGDSAFESCTSLASITIPDSVTSIGERAFGSCTSLASVTIGNNVTSIGLGAFLVCSSLTSVTIPSGVTSIGWSAFSRCSSLTSVTFATGSNIADANFGSYAFPEGIYGSGGNSLKTSYSAGKAGTYTRTAVGSTWTKS
jgi:hypothetical protein